MVNCLIKNIPVFILVEDSNIKVNSTKGRFGRPWLAVVMQCSICNCSWINFWGIWKGFGGGAWFKVGQKKFCLLLSPESEKFEAFHIWMQPCATFVYCHLTLYPFLSNLSFYGSSKLHLFATTVFQSWGTHPLRTPSTRFNIKKDPTTISGMKKTQLNTLPRASLVWKNRGGDE